ncbi:MAG: class I SAM-dependent methyltransferase [Acidimicrobiales bacterium]
MTDWAAYLADYHDANPGVTEDLLADALDSEGRSPYAWLIEAVHKAGALVVDLACGNGPVLRRLDERRAVGIDRSHGELARGRATAHGMPLVRGDMAAVPIRGGIVGAVTVSMALMLASPLEAVLAEARRLLVPGGVLAATVPTRSSRCDRVSTQLLFVKILTRLGQLGTDYPEHLPAKSLPARFAAAGFELGEDRHAHFVRQISTAAEADLVMRSFYTPGTTEERLHSAAEMLRRKVARAPVTLAYPIRRLVAVAR